MTARQTIDDFLARKRLAVVGLSRNPKDFSRMLFQEFRRRGYDVVPVTPQASELDGLQCFAGVRDISPPVEGALLMTNAAVTDGVVRECAEAGIPRVWMYRAAGAGAVSPAAVEFCRANGIAVIPGECPYMFFPHDGPHKLHGILRRLLGSYPK